MASSGAIPCTDQCLGRIPSTYNTHNQSSFRLCLWLA